jgi:hypothetical protein
VPCALVFVLLGSASGVAALVGLYLALGARIACMTQPKPLGAEPADVPHLTLVHPHGIITNGFRRPRSSVTAC